MCIHQRLPFWEIGGFGSQTNISKPKWIWTYISNINTTALFTICRFTDWKVGSSKPSRVKPMAYKCHTCCYLCSSQARWPNAEWIERSALVLGIQTSRVWTLVESIQGLSNWCLSPCVRTVASLCRPDMTLLLIVLPHCQHQDLISHWVTLPWHWPNQSLPHQS